MRKVIRVGRDSVDSKPDFDGDESVDELVPRILSPAIEGDRPNAEGEGNELTNGSDGEVILKCSLMTTLRLSRGLPHAIDSSTLRPFQHSIRRSSFILIERVQITIEGPICES